MLPHQKTTSEETNHHLIFKEILSKLWLLVGGIFLKSCKDRDIVARPRLKLDFDCINDKSH